jgi:hypothetical protein
VAEPDVQRYKMIAYYEDAETQGRVAQAVVVVEKDVKAAVEAVRTTLGRRAIGGRIIAIEVKERHDVETGVVFTGEPYIPLHWPTLHRRAPVAEGAEPQVLPASGAEAES